MKKIAHKYEALYRCIIVEYGELQLFAADMQFSPAALTRRLTGKICWTVEEMIECCRLLNIRTDEITKYFDPENRLWRAMSA